ncbi:MAG: hypothetical protein IH892_20745 [Planctomycetes bacterium]|nr:hypothetical protein [Planctomycetota bacterium]
MNSSWLLLNVFRRKIWVCLFIEFVIVLLVALNDIKPSRRESIWDGVNVAFGLGVVLSLFLWYQIGCNRLPFPVSIRQRVWLPMIAFGIIWAAGALAVFFAVLCLSTWPYPLLSAIPSVVGRIPLYLLAFMIVFRIVRSKPYMICVVVWLSTTTQSGKSEWFEACILSYPLWWPLPLAAIAYYVWEAPIQLGQQDRLLPVSHTGVTNPFLFRDMNISERRVPLSWIGDVIEYAMLVAACILFYSTMSKLATLAGPLSYIRLLIPLLLTFSMVMMCRTLFQQAQCSGFGDPRAFGLALMQMTGILVPLARALGVQKGIAAWCDRCQKRKFIWQPECLHCGNPGPGTISNRRLASLVQGKPVQMPLRGRIAFKAFIPLQIVFIGVFAGGISNRPFVSNRVSMVFGQGATQQDKERAIEYVKAWVEANTSLEDWPVRSMDSAGASEDVPERFRLNVTFNTGSLSVQGLGLRWDPAITLPKQMAQHLADEIKDLCPVRLIPSNSVRDSSGPLFQTRGYLDNRIHWKMPHVVTPRHSRP